MIDKRNTRNEKNDHDEGGNSEDDHGEYEDGTGSTGDGAASHSKRRQVHSFYFTTDRVLYTYMTSYLPTDKE